MNPTTSITNETANSDCPRGLTPRLDLSEADQRAFSAPSVTLSDAQIERLADLIAARLRGPVAASHVPARRLVDAQTLAAELGVTRQTIYAHAVELAGERVGNGRRPRWRFDLEAARAAMGCRTSMQPDGANASAGAEKRPSHRRRSARLPNGLPPAGSILASRPRGAS